MDRCLPNLTNTRPLRRRFNRFPRQGPTLRLSDYGAAAEAAAAAAPRRPGPVLDGAFAFAAPEALRGEPCGRQVCLTAI